MIVAMWAVLVGFFEFCSVFSESFFALFAGEYLPYFVRQNNIEFGVKRGASKGRKGIGAWREGGVVGSYHFCSLGKWMAFSFMVAFGAVEPFPTCDISL